MITSDVLAAMRRRWYVLLLGLLATGFLVFHVHNTPAVYSSQRSVRVVAPPGVDENSLVHASSSLISLAGLVERTINGDGGLPATASPNITLADRGIRHGSVIFLPNDGGQWSYQFDRPELIVQAAGASPEEVRRRQDAQVDKIQQTLTSLQRTDPVAGRVEARVVVPSSAIASSLGRAKPAIGVTLLLGLGLSMSAAVVVDRFVALLRRRHRRLSLRNRIPNGIGGART